jgi:hypothetical protein
VNLLRRLALKAAAKIVPEVCIGFASELEVEPGDYGVVSIAPAVTVILTTLMFPSVLLPVERFCLSLALEGKSPKPIVQGAAHSSLDLTEGPAVIVRAPQRRWGKRPYRAADVLVLTWRNNTAEKRRLHAVVFGVQASLLEPKKKLKRPPTSKKKLKSPPKPRRKPS